MASTRLPEHDLFNTWLREEPLLPDGPDATRQLSPAELDRALISAWRTRKAPSNNPAARAVLEDAIAQAWIARNAMEPNMNAALGIMTILLLHYNGHKGADELNGAMIGLDPEDIQRALHRGRRQAVALLQELGRRALHSAHAEILANEWLYSQSAARMDDLGRRLERLRTVLKPRLQLADVQLIRQFCRAAELRSSADLAVISLALRAALGESVDTSPLLSRAVISAGLIELHRVLPTGVSGYPIDLPTEGVSRLESLLRYIHEQDIHPILLDPLIWTSTHSRLARFDR